ncbi:transporter [Synergistales bacterium]|nr:transporter [Synergistales bacterium]
MTDTVPVFTLSHYIYMITIALVLFLMVRKKDVVIVCLIGLTLITVSYTGSVITGIQALFSSLLTAGKDLFDIMLVISIMVAMLKSLDSTGASEKMFAPVKKMIKNPLQAYFLLGAAAYISASFFWPTPATALVGPLLIPVCVQVGLPAMAAAMAFNIFGHGMGLSGDLIIQGAIKLSANSSGVDIGSMFTTSAILSLTCGIVAGIVGYIMMRKEIKAAPKFEPVEAPETDVPKKDQPYAVLFAILTPLAFFAAAGAMIAFKIRGGDATALIGGTGVLMLIISSIVSDKRNCFEKSVGYLREGFMFGIKVFSPVIPIAAFFYLGGVSSDEILGEGAPQLMFDIGKRIYTSLPLGKIPLAFGNTLIGMIAGLEGSGFVGLPLTGSMAAAFGSSVGANIAPLAGVGQMGSIWSGGGTLVPWSFGLAATAGIAGVSPVELARKNFIPVCCGLFASTVVGIFMM